jgi:putative acetyltransferase
LNIREAKNSDSKDIKKLIFSVLHEYGLQSDPFSTDKDLDDIEGFYNINGGFLGVVEENHVIVATVGIIKVDNSTCELRKMYLYPNQRGKGLGKKLLEFSLSKAKELKFNRMILETAGPLKEAISLYKKYGFSEYKPNHLSERCDQAFEFYIT